MYYNEHDPPHFHAVYGGQRASILIESLEESSGRLPRRAHALVVEWAAMHKAELLENWQLAREHVEPKRIEPLE